ncbi:c-x8-c-x5-c-x3-h zinc finger protein [Fusarium austroafricanum]|uniref:C-x8-c-x5-c-x3-h zinc finger protein n=1 Tax=Fusarium austroafricanum TaxID=2364996 RepID=A0A8H4NU44_9HYPO|nr:c-x8-c-x5-c-x3-h zinc finger protein [Fusarium austroafricanum]
MEDFIRRYQALHTTENLREKLLQDVLVYCSQFDNQHKDEVFKLKQKLAETELDLKAATQSRRELQKTLDETEDRAKCVLAENNEIKNTNPYILILIDGDGLIFDNRYISQGLEGGKEAARDLHTVIANLCAHERTGSLEIICHVVANVSGLSKALCRDGSIEDPSLMREFALGFTQAKTFFDFIDVGYGKERADYKIQETARWHLRNQNCQHIMLGIGHDAGYAPFLDQLLENNESPRCVSLLRGGPMVRELEKSGFKTLELEGSIFRTTKLVEKSQPLTQKPSAQRTESIKIQSSPATMPTQAAVLTPATSTASMSPPHTWAKVTKSASPPPKLTMPLPPKQDKNKAVNKTRVQPAWSPGPRGLDPPVSVNIQVMETIKRRSGSDKLCNNHYLRGPCSRIDICPFVHSHEPSQDEWNALAMLARQNPCTSGQDCEVDDCIYGHNCPNVANGVCTRQYCKFKVDAHPPNTKFTNKHINDN